MSMSFKSKAILPVALGVALALTSCSVVAPKYFERDKIRTRMCDSIYETSKHPFGAYSGKMSSPNFIKEKIEDAAACDPNFASLKNTGDLCFGPYSQMLIRHIFLLHSANIAKFQDINHNSLRILYDKRPTISNIDSLHMLKTEIDSLALGLTKQFKQNLLTLFLKLQNLRTDFLGEFYALQELQMKFNMDTTSTTRLENAVSAFYYSLKKNKIASQVESNFARGLAENHMDCDLSGYLFMQFGIGIGLDLVGVYLRPLLPSQVGHFAVAYRMNGKITHYIETTQFLYNPEFSSMMDIIIFSASRRSELTANIQKDIRGLLTIREILRSSSIGIYSAERWEADNKGQWKSIEYIEASEL